MAKSGAVLQEKLTSTLFHPDKAWDDIFDRVENLLDASELLQEYPEHQSAGVDLNAKYGGQYILSKTIECYNPQLALVKLLVQHGADPTTGLNAAAKRGFPETLQFLLLAGADVKATPDLRERERGVLSYDKPDPRDSVSVHENAQRKKYKEDCIALIIAHAHLVEAREIYPQQDLADINTEIFAACRAHPGYVLEFLAQGIRKVSAEEEDVEEEEKDATQGYVGDFVNKYLQCCNIDGIGKRDEAKIKLFVGKLLPVLIAFDPDKKNNLNLFSDRQQKLDFLRNLRKKIPELVGEVLSDSMLATMETVSASLEKHDAQLAEHKDDGSLDGSASPKAPLTSPTAHTGSGSALTLSTSSILGSAWSSSISTLSAAASASSSSALSAASSSSTASSSSASVGSVGAGSTMALVRSEGSSPLHTHTSGTASSGQVLSDQNKLLRELHQDRRRSKTT